MKRKDPFPQVVLFMSAGTYLVALFFSGWEYRGFPYWLIDRTRTGELGAVLAVAILVASVYALRVSDRRLVLTRLYLAIGLIAVTALAMLELWHGVSGFTNQHKWGGHPGPGGIVAIACSLAIVWSVLAIDFGGLRRLLRRDRDSVDNA
ncbi:MAG: hypothetical protein ABSB96_03015 [Gaiellaceae bacterium]